MLDFLFKVAKAGWLGIWFQGNSFQRSAFSQKKAAGNRRGRRFYTIFAEVPDGYNIQVLPRGGPA